MSATAAIAELEFVAVSDAEFNELNRRAKAHREAIAALNLPPHTYSLKLVDRIIRKYCVKELIEEGFIKDDLSELEYYKQEIKTIIKRFEASNDKHEREALRERIRKLTEMSIEIEHWMNSSRIALYELEHQK